MRKLVVFTTVLLWICAIPAFPQKVDNASVKSMVERYKSDPKGPYKDIRWFCKDGTTLPPNERCPEPGVQRARYKDEVISLAKTNHIYLGQILSTTPNEDFWDAPYNHSRQKQYLVERYLRSIDDGWILRRAQYYRGAFQAEDEETWGKSYLLWLLADTNALKKNFFLLRQTAKYLPHQGDDNRTQRIRALSLSIADQYPSFQNIRIKIHGQPDALDIVEVKSFKEKNLKKLNNDLIKQFDELIAEMELYYQPTNLNALKKYLKQLPKDAEISNQLSSFINLSSADQSGEAFIKKTAELLWNIRLQSLSVKKSTEKLALLDVSINLEEIIFREITSWTPNSLKDLLSNIRYLSVASAGCAYIEIWEWQEISQYLMIPGGEELALKHLIHYLESSRSVVEWGTGLMKAQYKEVVDQFVAFEPLASGFIDDQIRSTLLLPLGSCVGELGDFISSNAGLTNAVMNIPNQSHIRGLNPGYAKGELVVVRNDVDDLEVSADKIYIFNSPSSNLKPVAGIATVSEGNMVSHVQLLARNLGIPNAVVSLQNMDELSKYAGTEVFYAVSNKGTVIMKSVDKMTVEEKKLFEVKKRDETKISVPSEKIDLEQKKVINLRQINATHSGQLCGPKAANLGQLKLMFPEHVVEGLVIPFGIFKMHMDQTIPGQNRSYWEFLNEIFTRAAQFEEDGLNDAEIDNFVLNELQLLREAIKNMPLLPDFTNNLHESFVSVFGKRIGEIPVFIRSDTNMEDLKDFTGAGLNLTVFNVVLIEKILQGIKDVWASPYTERSYKWRQRYLLNPEYVFPSILIIPSVDVDYSGVLITKGLVTGELDDLTVAFSRGAGGAVDGQVAESFVLGINGENLLLSPSREPVYNTLPSTGGLLKRFATFETPILNSQNLLAIREFALTVKQIFPSAPGIQTTGPFDVELGFKGNKIWLFQIRPFVENKKAVSSTYLESITPAVPANKLIPLSTPLYHE